MFAVGSPTLQDGSVAVLFRPSIVPLIDAFRSLDILSEGYDIHVLEAPEQDLARYVEKDAARAIVSDAMLLAFALSRQRGQPLSHQAPRSRKGTLDEYCVLTLIGASENPDSELAFEAAAALRIASLDFTLSLATDLLRRIDLGGLPLECPSLSEFRAIVSEGLITGSSADCLEEPSSFKFQ
ncbi:hypothetical protein [Microvirga rosea]|uniref:hypothetical protein n=1 Tax=Microvirga rosea TaxID=2715425 RepID=UPI001D0B0F01|nr:hypothetical protein [Microvirga rosea]MCB8820169.1 hypothetical protein [Microvirga rosea]